MTFDEYLWSIHRDIDFAIMKTLGFPGVKGQQYIDPGIVYAPYIPLVITPVLFKPKTWKERLNIFKRFKRYKIMRRYSKTSINKDLFSHIEIN